MESPCWSGFILKDSWRGPKLEQRSVKRRKEQQTGADPHSSSPCTAQWAEGRRVGSERLKLGLQRGGVGGRKVVYVLSLIDFNWE